MGQRGPSRTPLKLLRARGSRKAEHRTEPGLEPGAPVPPSHLSDVERAAWLEVCGFLGPAGVIRKCDGPALLVFVDAYSALLAAREEGNLSKRSVARNDLLRACGRLGLTPADATNVTAALTREDDPLEAFLKKG